jgi:hypothetical protein
MREKPNSISLPRRLREEFGALVGQFLQLRGKEELVLEICIALDPQQESAYVAPEHFERIHGAGNLGLELLEVTLGCDPEFFIVWGSRSISAATYLPFQGQIGSDGALGELRPMYGRHEDQVVSNLQGLIPRIPRTLQRSKWARGFPAAGDKFTYEAHSYHFGTAAGFHVHLGIPPEILNTRKDFNRAAMRHIVMCLDWYVSVPLVSLEVNHRRRLASKYGRPGDFRPSNMTLEYRTPGGFYLRSPKLSRGLLGMSLAVTEAVVSRMKVVSKEFTALHRLSASDLQEILPIPNPSKIQSTLADRNAGVAESQLSAIYGEMRKLPSYQEHERAIEEFFSAVETREQPGPNLLHNWKE